MKKIPAESKVICENNRSYFNYFGWPSVDRLPDGTLAMVCSGFRTSHVDPFGKGVICYSWDEGKTWTRPAVVIDTLEDDRDCGILVYNGKVLMNSFNNGTFFQKDYGDKRFLTPFTQAYYQILNHRIDEEDEKTYGSVYVTSDNGYQFSEVKRAPVQSPHGPCLMPDGKLFWIGTPMKMGEKHPGQLDCYSIDENETFTYLSTITSPEGCCFCEPHAIAVDGKIIVHIRENVSFAVWQCESEDGGKTWNEAYPLGVENGSPPHLLRHSNGTLISVYGRRRPPYGQRVMFSRDDGKTWDVDYILRDDAPDSDLGYPATVELKDGSLLTVYYQKESKEGPCVIMQSIWQLPKEYR